MNEVILSLDDVGFSYYSRIGYKREHHGVLTGVSFDVYKGETLGIIGRNGCGKSTLLKLLSGIFQPDSGKIVTGDVKVALQSLNAGFLNSLSGRDNALISAMLLGHEKKHARQLLDQIKEMSELGSQFESPVKTYSAGMRARLGFATAVTMQTDVLLIDEVLGVGDAKFREKAEGIIREKIKQGMTVILVSHAAHQLKRICSRAILLENGTVAAQGDVSEVLAIYQT